MAQSPKGSLVQGFYKPIHGSCAMYFYLGVFVYNNYYFINICNIQMNIYIFINKVLFIFTHHIYIYIYMCVHYLCKKNIFMSCTYDVDLLDSCGPGSGLHSLFSRDPT